MKTLLAAMVAVSVCGGCANNSSQLEPGTRAILLNHYLQQSRPMPVQAYQIPIQRSSQTNCREVTPGNWSCMTQ